MIPVTSVADDIEVSRSSAIDSYQWLREVYITKLLQNPIQLGGPGKIVKIDESLFRHKPKVLLNNCVSATGYCFLCVCFYSPASPWKGNNTGTVVNASHEPALGYMEIVSRRDASTLLPIIQAHVLPGTIIYSDEWAVYNQVHNLPNITSHSSVNHSSVNHSSVNHSLHFVDAATGVHTHSILKGTGVTSNTNSKEWRGFICSKWPRTWMSTCVRQPPWHSRTSKEILVHNTLCD